MHICEIGGHVGLFYCYSLTAVLCRYRAVDRSSLFGPYCRYPRPGGNCRSLTIPPPAIHTGYTSVPGRLLLPFPIPLSVWWFWFSTVRCCGCFFPHNYMYISWFLVALMSVGRGILTRIVFFSTAVVVRPCT